MLHLDVGSHVFQGQLCSTIPKHQHPEMLHTVRLSLAVHLTLIGCGRFLPGNGPSLTHHIQHLCQISYNIKLIKEANYFVKSTLQLHLIGGGN